MSSSVGRACVVFVLVSAIGMLGGSEVAARDSRFDRTSAAAQKPIRFDKSEVYIEVNQTDGDAGLHVSVGGEDWKSLSLRDPRGRTVLDVRGKERLRSFGLAGATLEGSERTFEELPFRRFKSRFPEGRYRFTGTTIEGRRLIGSHRLTHDVPRGPALLAPAEDAVVSPEGLVVRWTPVTKPSGIEIVRYVVIVTLEPSDNRVLSMELASNATSAAIPAEFLEPRAEFKVELVAREKSGNKAITEVSFKTGG